MSSRRLSDLTERPAWDATSSNLDKLKLTAEELERRKASRVSKHRPMPTAAEVKHDFVAAWARTSSTSTIRPDPDADRDQDSIRTPDPAAKAQLPAIDYGSVLESLRRSPAVGKAAALVDQARRDADESRREESPTPQTDQHEDHGLSAAAQHTLTGTTSLEATLANAAAPSAHVGSVAVTSSTLLPSAPLRAFDEATYDGRNALHRTGEADIIPAALRPRFHAADATTIISCSDEDAEPEDEEAEKLAPSSGGGDTMTAAFEAAFFGRPAAAAAAAAATATTTARGGLGLAAPFSHASDDVERRLRALEACVASASSDVSAGEIAELRGELCQVQADNAKLRQELATFSTHASSLLTQLQAQVQQLLRTSGGGSVGTSGVIPTVASTAAQARPQAAVQQHPALAAAASASSISSQPAPALSQQAPAFARRNIFTDVSDDALLRPPSEGGDVLQALRGGGGGRYVGHAVEPGSRVAGIAAATAASPRPGVSTTGGLGLGAVPAPYAPRPVSLNNVEDADVALPSFATFRRSSGAAAFTAFRPAAAPATVNSVSAAPSPLAYGATDAAAAAGLGSDGAAPTSVAQRSFPSAFQPRNLSGTAARGGPSTAPGGVLLTGEQRGGAAAAGLFAAAMAAEAASAASGGAYAAALAASAAGAAATGSGPATVELARSHAGLPQPLVFSVGQEFRSARASGLAAHDSMSLSAHVAAAAAQRGKSSFAR
ncbi:hypothetical protein HYH02_003433 [Chlamydomonas schloesseri]|uniref:Uncharacterized protein n=1 Tax=Chlamydomonas schloesseri TaxID=2026947 RepID=A0A835WQU1_9CHLO|nr:hypothetical protein HYH02_003433 [Chlamydomonas schloesseri]|eukprot:KAG2451653.1 hypothetical protein HYH02_003433 [Chlamydomonas schloesseri]